MEALDLGFKKRRIACYVRSGPGTVPLKEQLLALEVYCLKNRVSRHELFCDQESKAGQSKNRFGFGKLMNQIETGAIDSVIAPSLSTFAQSPSDLFNALEILSRHRTALIGLKENFYFDPADIVFSQLLSVLAQMKK